MAFYFMFQLMGVRSSPIKGDYMLYIISGIAMFMTHNTAVQAVSKAEGPTSGMMQHAPMNRMIAVCSAALQSFYQQTITIGETAAHLPPCFQHSGNFQSNWPGRCVLAELVYRRGHWHGVFGLDAVAPPFVNILLMVFRWVNMLASGKMFVANTLPSFMLVTFDWNTLFHCVDQARGMMFINYSPMHSNFFYPLKVALVAVVLGLMGEFSTRKRASKSWGATR